MKVRQFSISMIGVLALVNIGSLTALAQDRHSHAAASQQNELASNQSKASALIAAVRQATERFKDVSVAKNEGYSLQFGCVSGPDYGAMGLHFVNFDKIKNEQPDPTQPQIVIYEANADGSLRLTGADFLIFADAWNEKHSDPPQLMGQLFHLFESPNRFNLPAFYTLHVWAWKTNPNGAFVNWHPNVSCQNFSGQTP